MTTEYPKSVTLRDDTTVELRLMTAADRSAVLEFARQLPEEDLLFLRVDLTKERVVDDWIEHLESGHSTSLVAYDDSGLIGYATVHTDRAPWTRRVGELRVNVAPAYRGKGLGRILTSQIFDIARGLELSKLTASMIIDQHGAQKAFRHLGFVPEAILAEHVEDRNGQARDLVIMSHMIHGHHDRVAEPLRI